MTEILQDLKSNRLIRYMRNQYYPIRKEKCLAFLESKYDLADFGFDSYEEMLYCVLKQIDKPRCLLCGKPITYQDGRYNKFCGVSCREKYLNSNEMNEKRKQTSVKHFGVDSVLKRKDLMETAMIEKYGVKSAMHLEKVKQKMSENCQRKYGVSWSTQRKDVIERQRKSINENIEKIKEARKNALNEKFGVDNVFQIESVKDKIKKTNLERHGVEFCSQSKEVKEKVRKTLNDKSLAFAKENDLTPISEIFDVYSAGWYISGKFSDSIVKYNARDFVKNSDIEKIKEYSESSIAGSSREEKEVLDFIKLIYNGEIIENSRKIISPLELDIYILDKKLAIEFNGVFWHSENNDHLKKYHLRKTQLCEEKGIRLIHIFQCDWRDKQEICKSIIASAFGIYNKKVYARKCEAKEITQKEYELFLKENHIQGSVKSSIRFGLFYNQELVQVIGFGKSRFKKDEIELHRMCSKLNTQVIGGFSKLLKHSNVNDFISYVDRSLYNGKGYFSTGFDFDSYTPPSYFYYTKRTGKLSRQTCQKHKLKNLLGDKFDEDLTESENMKRAGFFKIYDCGNIKVRFKKNKKVTE